jgi:uncharacterized protein YyaL (SSP411 family)
MQEIAKGLGRNAEEIQGVIQAGKKKLLAGRTLRETPFIDKTLYTSLNGMLISAYFHAFAVLGDEEVRAFGVKSLERILAKHLVGGVLVHAENIPAMLDDYVFLIDALIAGYEATARQGYLVRADELMEVCLAKFFDQKEGGFFDTEREVLGTRLKKIEDIPHASANALAALLLRKLALMTGKDEYRQQADRSLRLFAGTALEMSIHAGTYLCALEAHFNMLKLAVEAQPDGELARAARALGGTMYTAIVYGDDHNRVIPCKGTICYEPVSDPSRLSRFDGQAG